MQPNQFGKYLLLKRLAVGGMAEIFLARQTGLQGFEKLVVVKKILPQLATEAAFVEMFLDEARLAASLNHPNVVQIYDLGKEQDAYYIAMEFIAGHDLASMVKKARRDKSHVPVELVARMIAYACEGLHYAHTMKDMRGQPLKLVHRDISPSNILVSYQGGVKVVDFGIAKAESQSTKTQAGTVKGKFSYMSPEQIRNQPLDGRSDVFALGITLYEVLVGKRLFKRDNELAIIADILEGVVPPPSSIRPEIPAELDAIVARALEKDVRKRFESAREMQLALEGWLAKQGGGINTVTIADYMELTFAEEVGAYHRLLAELPTATNEQLAKLLAANPEGGPESGSSSGSNSSFSDSRLRGITKDTALPRDEDATGIVLTRATPKWLKAAYIGGPLLLAVLAGGGYWAWNQQGKVVVVRASAGTLELKTQPPGAAITLNGAATGLVTPTTLDKLAFGPMEVRLELSGYEAKTLNQKLDADAPSQSLNVELARLREAPGKLKIETVPPGAKLFLDGRALATPSPFEVAELEAGREHMVRAAKDGFLDEAQTVTVKSGEAAALKITLRPRAEEPPPPGPKKPGRELVAFELTSTPPADVMFEGKKLCHTPCSAKLPAGKANLTFVDGASDLNAARTVSVDKASPRAAIVFQKGKLAANVEPWADVYLGDKKLGTTPFAPRELYEGSYSIRLVNSEIGAMRNVKVQVDPGKTTVLREKLN